MTAIRQSLPHLATGFTPVGGGMHGAGDLQAT
jgi:hypothetical protein